VNGRTDGVKMAHGPSSKSHACRHVGFLKKIRRAGGKNRAQLISGCDQGQIYALCECVDNLLRGAVKPTGVQKERLKKHIDVLANLANPNIDWGEKRTYLRTQEGGAILSTVLGVVLPALISYLASRV